jgi:hypothetical protein
MNNMKEIEDFCTNFLDYENDLLPATWIKLGILIWGLGITAAGVVAFGFGIYYLLFLILGSVCLITCPCIGIGILGGTVGIWASMLYLAGGILKYTSAIATIFGILSPITLIQESNRNEETIVMVAFTWVFNLLVAYYINDIGVYESILSDI